METHKVTMRCQGGLIQLRECPVCHYFVAEATDIIWKRQPRDLMDDGEVESCVFCRQQSDDGSLQWTGVNMVEMCSFMKQDITAVTPGGPMQAETPDGKIAANPGQWVIKKGGRFQVVDNP